MTNQITTGNVDSRQAGQAVAQQMNAIFDTLKNFYTQYYLVIKSEKQELQMMRQWAAELMRSGVSEDMLRIGMARAKSHAVEDRFCKWPSVSDFIIWCHGLPEPKSAYIEAIRNCHNMKNWEPTHAAVALVFEVINVKDFMRLDEKLAQSEYLRAYSKVSARVLTGELLEYSKPKEIKSIECKQSEESKELGVQSLVKIKAEIQCSTKKQHNKNHISKEDLEIKKAEMIRKLKNLKRG